MKDHFVFSLIELPLRQPLNFITYHPSPASFSSCALGSMAQKIPNPRVRKQREETVLHRMGFHIDDMGDTALHVAACTGNIAMVKLLLQKRPEQLVFNEKLSKQHLHLVTLGSMAQKIPSPIVQNYGAETTLHVAVRMGCYTTQPPAVNQYLIEDDFKFKRLMEMEIQAGTGYDRRREFISIHEVG